MRQRFAILAVCTANICRSPLAELLLVDRLDHRRFEVASAGVRGWRDQPMDDAVQHEARRLGLDPSGFRSRPLLAEHVSSADLVLTATREHRAGVLELVPNALRRTYTLREFAALGPRFATQAPEEIVRDAARHRSAAGPDIDVPDPYRAGADVHRQVADMVDVATARIAEVLEGRGRPA